jgi:MinD-like ATPase involved in chromosome partitioning or flagellar assembly
MEPKVVTVVSEKGGVGKTVISYGLSLAGLLRGLRVVAVDLSEGALTQTLGHVIGQPHVGDALLSPRRASSFVRPVRWAMPGPAPRGTLGVIGADPRLNIDLMSLDDLRAAMADLRMTADLVVIDNPPVCGNLGLIGLSVSMRAADRIVVVTDPDLQSIRLTGKTLGLALDAGVLDRVAGVVVCNARRPMTRVTRGVLDGLANSRLSFPTVVWNRAEWQAARTGEVFKSLSPDLCALAEALLDEVMGGWRCNPAARLAYANLEPRVKEAV